MASPNTMISVVSVAAGGEASLLQGQSGRTLQFPSRVRIAANREDVLILYTITVGGARILLSGGAALNATAGDIPIVPDNFIADTFGGAGDEIVILAANGNAAAKEARVLVFVIEIDDNALQQAMQNLGQVAPVF